MNVPIILQKTGKFQGAQAPDEKKQATAGKRQKFHLRTSHRKTHKRKIIPSREERKKTMMCSKYLNLIGIHNKKNRVSGRLFLKIVRMVPARWDMGVFAAGSRCTYLMSVKLSRWIDLCFQPFPAKNYSVENRNRRYSFGSCYVRPKEGGKKVFCPCCEK